MLLVAVRIRRVVSETRNRLKYSGTLKANCGLKLLPGVRFRPVTESRSWVLTPDLADLSNSDFTRALASVSSEPRVMLILEITVFVKSGPTWPVAAALLCPSSLKPAMCSKRLAKL